MSSVAVQKLNQISEVSRSLQHKTSRIFAAEVSYYTTHCLCDCCIRYPVCLQPRSAYIKVTVHMNAGDFSDIYSRKQ